MIRLERLVLSSSSFLGSRDSSFIGDVSGSTVVSGTGVYISSGSCFTGLFSLLNFYNKDNTVKLISIIANVVFDYGIQLMSVGFTCKSPCDSTSWSKVTPLRKRSYG